MSKLATTNVNKLLLSAEELQSRAANVAEQLTLLSNTNRLLILCHLLDGEQSVGKLQSQLELSQSALSQHLSKLRDAGMVATRRDRQVIFYRIADPRVQHTMEALYRIYCV